MLILGKRWCNPDFIETRKKDIQNWFSLLVDLCSENEKVRSELVNFLIL